MARVTFTMALLVAFSANVGKKNMPTNIGEGLEVPRCVFVGSGIGSLLRFRMLGVLVHWLRASCCVWLLLSLIVLYFQRVRVVLAFICILSHRRIPLLLFNMLFVLVIFYVKCVLCSRTRYVGI